MMNLHHEPNLLCQILLGNPVYNFHPETPTDIDNQPFIINKFC